ncbi:hypothetical protein FRB95_013316 [Tulasnella sp. JGI-2019a]|nr:hypothetical protein FRB95_013316 [Tulasnella sp. JGI-2019a]
MAQLTDPLGGPIFPNLLSLEHGIDGAEYSGLKADMERWTPLPPLLVGPGLEQLTFSFYTVTERVVEDSIRSLAHIAPQIHTFHVINHVNDLSPDYSAFSNLRWLTVRGCISNHTWKRLAFCPRLESISLLESYKGRCTETQPDYVTFSHMKTLSIDGCRNAEFILALLRTTAMPALQTLNIKFPVHGSAALEATRRKILGFMDGSLLLKDVVINGRVTLA